MEPPSSQAGKVATSAGIVLAGAALGGAAGALYLPADKKVGTISARLLGGVAGAIAGAGLTGVVSLGLAEFVGGDWQEIEQMSGVIGAGGVGLLAAIALAKEVFVVKDALAQPSGAPVLPGGSAPAALPGAAAAQNYDAGESDSGRTLTLNVGDTVTITLPAQNEQWVWSATPGLVNLTSQKMQNSATVPGGLEGVAVFTAAAKGSGQIQGTVAGATYVLNINVI